jgi:hypothetical protein
MKPIHSACLAALIVLSALAPIAHADESGGASPAAQSKANATPVFSFKFPGGSIDDFVKFMASAEASRNGFFNLVIQADGHTQPVPAFEVRGANGYALAGAVAQLFSSERGWSVDVTGDINANGILVIRRSRPPQASETRPQSIAHLIKPMGLFEFDDVVSALQLAWQQDTGGPGPAPTLKFHEKSAILLINARDRDHNLAVMVLQNMLESQSVMKMAPAKP